MKVLHKGLWPTRKDNAYFLGQHSFNLYSIPLSSRFVPTLDIRNNKKISVSLELNNNPYSLEPVSLSTGTSAIYDHTRALAILRQSEFLTKFSPFMIKFFLDRHQDIFPYTSDAFNFYRSASDQHAGFSCLSRAIFAAKTSRSFREYGVLFIGCKFPATSLHAWIIENSRQPDSEDREWINYTPVSAICYA